MNNTIHCLWIGSELSLMERLSLLSFIKLGYRVHLYTYDNIGYIPYGVININAESVLPKSDIFTYQVGIGKGSYSGFSNLFRYKVLLDNGGYWCDLDVILLRKLPRINDEYPYFLASEKGKKQDCVATAIIGAIENSELMYRCYNYASMIDKNTVKWGQIGPKLLNQQTKSMNLVSYPPDLFYPVSWWEWRKFLEAKEIPDAISVHLWHQMWIGSAVDTNHCPKDSMYQKLVNRIML